MNGSTVRIEAEPTSSDAVMKLLVSLLDELRHAKTIADVAIATGAAHQELLDLMVEHEPNVIFDD